jgi:hypothetical protein
MYRALADGVVFIHFLWIVFLIFGGFIGRKNRVVGIFHIGGLVFAVVMQVFDWYCPLTHLEFWLRRKYDPYGIFPGSFISYYLEKLIYIEISRELVFILTLLLVLFNSFLYLKPLKDKKHS